MQEKSPVALEQVFCQRWVAGVEGGGSGLNIYIPVKETTTELDSVYFRSQSVKLEFKKEGMIYVGRFTSDFNKKKDKVMSDEPNAEFGNEMPEIPKKIPFELNDNECVISYLDGKSTKYFKVPNVVEKPMIAYPSPPPVKQ